MEQRYRSGSWQQPGEAIKRVPLSKVLLAGTTADSEPARLSLTLSPVIKASKETKMETAAIAGGTLVASNQHRHPEHSYWDS